MADTYNPSKLIIPAATLNPKIILSTRTLKEIEPDMLHLTPFRISVDEDVLTDLRTRLNSTRWPPYFSDADWRYGVEADCLRRLVKIWAGGFDWRAAEAKMNQYSHYRTIVDDQFIHFMHVPGKGPAPLPLILSHGWPWTFWDMHRVVEPLADPLAFGGNAEDAFDVIVPSLPGFGFSTPAIPGMNFWKTADLWHQLMIQTLGHRRYAAAGGDWGAMISAQLGHKYADHVHGIHLTQALSPALFYGERPWDVSSAAGQRKYAAHLAVQTIEPQTLAYGLHDSPVALLAWLLQRWQGWSDRGGWTEPGLPVEQMLINATLYWVTDSFASSARYYADAVHYPWSASHDRTPLIEAPAGFTFLAGDMPPGIDQGNRAATFQQSRTAGMFNVHHIGVHAEGGHFAHVENPAAVIADIRATFRDLRD